MAFGDHSDGLSRLPVPVERIALHPSADLAAPQATFLSQLIAEHDHLPPQRTRRRAPVSAALLSYYGTAVLTPPRLPPGYRKSLLA